MTITILQCDVTHPSLPARLSKGERSAIDHECTLTKEFFSGVSGVFGCYDSILGICDAVQNIQRSLY